MERVYKGIVGYKLENEKNSATHVILTLEEFYTLERKIDSLDAKIRNNMWTHQHEIKKERENANKSIEDMKTQAQKHLNVLQSDLNDAKGEIDRLNDLNSNLRRIMRERANAKRGLKPKKLHHGYMVLDSQQYNYLFRHGKKAIENYPCWRVRIQSPYDSSIPYKTIVDDIYSDLLKVFGASLNVKTVMNIDKKTKNHEEFEKLLRRFKELWNSDKNFIFKASYKANIKSGFWEVEYLVKSSITIPEDMRVS